MSEIKNALLESGEKENELAEAFSKLLENLGSTEKIKLFSDLTLPEIKHISALLTADDTVFGDFTDYYLMLKVSKGRGGRGELIQISENLADIEDEETDSSGIKSMLGL